MFSNLYENMNTPAKIIISIALMLFCGFAMTRVTKKLKLPNVTAYIITGIILGPFCFHLVPVEVIKGMDFLSDIALAFIAFGTGEFLKLDIIRKNGSKILIITLFEAGFAMLLVFIVTYFILNLSLSFSIILASLASATAPASTLMTIRNTNAKGHFVNTLLQIVAIDDIFALLAYSVAIIIAKTSTGSFNAMDVILPILMNIGVLVLGGLFGVLLKLLMPKTRSTDNRLIIVIATLFAFCGICTLLDISPLLGCMSMGMVYINITDDEKIFKQLNYFSPPILLLFFVRSGLNFDLSALVSKNSLGTTPLILVGLIYFIVRIIGKYLGAFLGAVVAKEEKSIRNYLGLALIPQAGVAIGLAALGARVLGGEVGQALSTVILASSILYEMIGPACAKLSLYLSKSYSNNIDEIVEVEEVNEEGKAKTEVDLLIERINKIRETIPTTYVDEEGTFTEAAYEQYDNVNYRQNRMGKWRGR